MNSLQYSYNSEDLAWETPILKLGGNVYINIVTKNRGLVVIERGESIDGKFPKVYVSKKEKCHLLYLSGDTTDKYIKIFLAEEPTTFEYAGEITYP